MGDFKLLVALLSVVGTATAQFDRTVIMLDNSRWQKVLDSPNGSSPRLYLCVVLVVVFCFLSYYGTQPIALAMPVFSSTFADKDEAIVRSFCRNGTCMFLVHGHLALTDKMCGTYSTHSRSTIH